MQNATTYIRATVVADRYLLSLKGGEGRHTSPAKAAKMIKHRRDYSICYRPEVAGGVVLDCDVKAVTLW